MRTSRKIRGAVAVAVVAAGASWLGMGGALAAARHAADPVPGIPAPRVEGPGNGDLIVSIEHIGRSSRLPSDTTVVFGLTNLPAIIRSVPEYARDHFLPRTFGGTRAGYGAPQRQGSLVARAETASRLPGTARLNARGATASDVPPGAPASEIGTPLSSVAGSPVPGLPASPAPDATGSVPVLSGGLPVEPQTVAEVKAVPEVGLPQQSPATVNDLSVPNLRTR
ncbi:hypothetical protein [Sphaerisporangium fuscum]|uniref:hypothetical protein n=1 Tax=Sphaerisporangium fuscum TaxID=2835868 RepID=UPI001BDC794D|nr:hypothetical protein [Sphaerisporangium fuscum]